MTNHLEGLNSLLAGKPQARTTDQVSGAQEGLVLSVTDAGVLFSIPDYDPNIRYGPAKYMQTDNPPQPGDTCLVLFVGKGVSRSWLISWIRPTS